jgi:hypothetical protein
MFKLDAKGPTASGRQSVTRTVTKENVQSAWCAANDLCDNHGAALSDAYGNFDRVVALGWLLGDVALGCLIEKADAFKVGGKAAKLARNGALMADVRCAGAARWQAEACCVGAGLGGGSRRGSCDTFGDRCPSASDGTPACPTCPTRRARSACPASSAYASRATARCNRAPPSGAGSPSSQC